MDEVRRIGSVVDVDDVVGVKSEDKASADLHKSLEVIVGIEKWASIVAVSEGVLTEKDEVVSTVRVGHLKPDLTNKQHCN